MLLVDLEKAIKMNLDRYNNIVKLDDEFGKISIIAHIPTPTTANYNQGYIVRYFTQKSNDVNSTIYEISLSSLSKLRNNVFYKIVSLDWRLTGSVDDIRKSNTASIRISSDKMPKIGLYLPNLIQFHQS